MKPDVDLTDGTFYADGGARAAYRWMRREEPVFRDRNGLAAASTYQAVLRAERTPELFSNTGGIRPDQAAMPYMIDMDDPQHLLRRKARQRGLHPKAGDGQGREHRHVVRQPDRRRLRARRVRLRPRYRRAAADGGNRRHARRAAVRSGDAAQVVRRSGVRTELERRRSRYGGGDGGVRRLLRVRDGDHRQAAGRAPTDDLFSILVNSEVEGEVMADEEILFETLLILIGGDETTRHTLSGGTEQLLRHPDQWDSLVADAQTVPAAIEEMLRWTSPVKNMARTLMADTEFHGTELKAGEKMVLLFESANFGEGVRRSGQFPYRPESQQPHGIRVRHALLSGQPAGAS